MAQSVNFYCDTNVPGTTSKTEPSSYSDVKILAEERTGTAFGKKRNLAVAYRILHFYARYDMNQGGDNGIPGNIHSEREGKVAVVYNNQAGKSAEYAELSTTRWGLELIDLINETILTANIC